jgi:hypothetical protein
VSNHLAAFPIMRIATGLFPFLTFICFGAVAFLGPHILVKSVGPEADRRRRVIRITGAVLIIVMVISATGFLLGQR